MAQGDPSLRQQGIQALREGDVERALDLLSRAVMGDPNDAAAQALLGVVYSRKDLHDQAQRALERALKIEPDKADHHFNYGVALERADKLAEAARSYDRCLKLNAEHAQASARLEALGSQALVWIAQAPPPAPTPTAVPSPPPEAGSPPPTGSPAFPSPPTMPEQGPPGTVKCGSCGEWSQPGLSCEFCSGILAPPPPPVAAAPPGEYVHTPGVGYVGAPVGYAGYAGDTGMTVGTAFGLRLLAFFVDTIILGLAFGLFARITTELGASGVPTFAFGGASLWIANILGWVIRGLYYGIMYSMWGASLGKMLVGLRVITVEGDNCSFWRAVLRELLGKLISVCFCFAGFLWMLWDSDQQALHDWIAGTYVVRK